ncbi:MAG: hypothetical protein KBD85_00790 [Elusimicrobia bacterium]|nr:hypothetical protein [Elusimicrobiota bacterium]MBP9127513.1 hypothetical protein [Elusimicrobiota bacterium]MBP9698531.1 hypothetical protein [Elusimicrobiota bacterium]
MTPSPLNLRSLLWKIFWVLVLLTGLSVGFTLFWRTTPRTVSSAEPPAVDLIAEMAKLHQAEDAALSSYAWRDRTRGRVAVPVERAKEAALADGFPHRPASPSEAR